MELNVNTDDVQNIVDILINLKRKHLPYAIRSTTNDMAIGMKKGGIDESSRSEFDHRRNDSFIRSITWSNLAKGTSIDSFESGAGIAARGRKTKVAKRMEKQETGGVLDRTYSPLKSARSSGNIKSRITGKNRHKNLMYVDVSEAEGQRWWKLMSFAAKRKMAVKVKSKRGKNKGKKYITRIAGLDTFKNKEYVSGRYKNAVTAMRYRLKYLYKENDSKTVTLKEPRPFINIAGRKQISKFPKYFKKNAEYQIKKAMEWKKK